MIPPGVHFLSNQVTFLLLDSFFSWFSYPVIPVLSVFVSLVMMPSQQGAVRSPLRHWSVPSVSPPTSRLDLPLDFYVTIKTCPSVIQINLSGFFSP